jgi:hypothetical protein
MTEAEQPDNEVARRIDGGAISLSDLTSRRTPVEWFEGIAVIQELCRHLLESGAGADGASVAPEDVVIDASGRVSAGLHGGSEDDSVVRQVGELLHLILADSGFPVPLRLVITQSTSTPPFYASIAEVSSALEYFERPDRPGLVRAVYERAQKLPAAPATGEVADRAEQKKPAPRTKKPVLKDSTKRRPLPKRLIYAAAAAVAAIAIGAGAVAWSSGRPQHVAPLADVEKESPKGSDRGRPASSAGRVKPAAAHGSLAQAPMKGTREATGSLARTSQPVSDAAPQMASEHSLEDQSPAHGASEAMVPVTFETYEVRAERSLEGAIYSASDGDVTPPLATYPRLPAEPPSSVRTEALSTLELLVSETGEVESVKLRGRPSHLGEALLATMNLSAAKTWRFVPAVRDGRPVKYRKLVQVWLSAP